MILANALNVSITLVIIAHVLVSLLLVLVVLMQKPKAEGLGASFGGGMADGMWGARTTDVLQKGTVYLGALFFILALVLAILVGKNNAQKSQRADAEAAMPDQQEETQAATPDKKEEAAPGKSEFDKMTEERESLGGAMPAKEDSTPAPEQAPTPEAKPEKGPDGNDSGSENKPGSDSESPTDEISGTATPGSAEKPSENSESGNAPDGLPGTPNPGQAAAPEKTPDTKKPTVEESDPATPADDTNGQ